VRDSLPTRKTGSNSWRKRTGSSDEPMKSCVSLRHISRRRRCDRPTEEITAFIDEHRRVYGVGASRAHIELLARSSCPICEILQIAPSTYYEFTRRAEYRHTAPPRVRRDEALKFEIQRIWCENYQVYGARKVWHQMKREGFQVAKCIVERVMRNLGLKGAIRGRRVRTTIPDQTIPRPFDRINYGLQILRMWRPGRGLCMSPSLWDGESHPP
jgi:hypothetical protein